MPVETATLTSGAGMGSPGSSTESPASPVSPAEPTAIRKPRRKKPRRNLPSGSDLATLAVMRAEGIPMQKIASALSLSLSVVSQALKSPEVQADITKFRSQLKGVHLASIHALAPLAWEKAERSLQAEDAKSWDAYTRGIYATEKIAASASGENQRIHVEHTGQVDSTPIKIQLQQLIALVKNESA